MLSNKKMTSKIFTLLLALFIASFDRISAQPADTIVSFVNIYPGSEIYELEGHSVLRVQWPGTDVAISYGTYDFNQPNFVYRFVKGETDYWVTAIPWDYISNSYTREGRRIVEHRLNMSPQQKSRLVELVSDNLQPENRTYRYNYVKDNCATRPLRIVELALGDTIIMGIPDSPLDSDQSFRSLMRHYHRNYPWYQFGIDLALGSGIDYTISNREKSFAPVLLDNQLINATVSGNQLVDSTIVVNDTAPDAAVLAATPWYATPLCVCTLVLLFIILMTIRDIKAKKVTRWVDAVLFGLFGLAGCLITFLVFISVHEATSPNLLLLWLNPFCFIPTFFIWINRCKFIIFSYQIANFVALIALLALTAFGLQTLNLAFVPLILADAIRALNYIYLNSNNIKCQK